MIPVAIRRWFLAHFALNLLIGGPLLLIPRSFLEGMGWITVDPASARFCGAALIAVGVQSLLTYNEGHHAVRTMLNFNMVWSWAAIAGLVFAAAEGAPNPVWALLAVFIAMSGVWFHLRVQLGEYMDLGAPISGELPIFPLSPQLQAVANAHDAQEVSHQFFVDESAVQESAPRKVVPPKPRGPDLIGDQPIDDRSANSLLGLVGQPGTPDTEAPAPDSDSLDPDAIAAMMAEAQTTGTAHAVSTEAAAAEASAEAAPAAPAAEEVAPAAQEASEPPATEVVATPEEATGDAVVGETTAAP
ncbi:MAG TPA: hypothetical protein VGG33_09825, partial [Polyangia bacterium]